MPTQLLSVTDAQLHDKLEFDLGQCLALLREEAHCHARKRIHILHCVNAIPANKFRMGLDNKAVMIARSIYGVGHYVAASSREAGASRMLDALRIEFKPLR